MGNMSKVVKVFIVLMVGFILFVASFPFLLFRHPGDLVWLFGEILLNAGALLMIAGPVVYWLVIPLYTRLKRHERKIQTKKELKE